MSGGRIKAAGSCTKLIYLHLPRKQRKQRAKGAVQKAPYYSPRHTNTTLRAGRAPPSFSSSSYTFSDRPAAKTGVEWRGGPS